MVSLRDLGDLHGMKFGQIESPGMQTSEFSEEFKAISKANWKTMFWINPIMELYPVAPMYGMGTKLPRVFQWSP